MLADECAMLKGVVVCSLVQNAQPLPTRDLLQHTNLAADGEEQLLKIDPSLE